MNWKTIVNLTGIVVLIVSFFMLLPIGVSLYFQGSDLTALIYSFAATFSSGLALFFLTRKSRKEDLRHRDGFIAVTASWVVVTFFSSLPFLFSHTFASFTDAYFEAMAGFTTTGASVIGNIEGVQKGVLFWRSLTQWLGGMGIVLFSLAVLPMLGGGGMQLFKAEVPEITVDKLRPRIVDTAKALWYIYTSLTALAAILFILGGMTVYDGISHSFTTLATGGFFYKEYEYRIL